MIPLPLTTSNGNDRSHEKPAPLNRMNHYATGPGSEGARPPGQTQYQPLSAPPTVPPKLPDVVQPPMPPTQTPRPPMPAQTYQQLPQTPLQSQQQPGNHYAYQQQQQQQQYAPQSYPEPQQYQQPQQTTNYAPQAQQHPSTQPRYPQPQQTYQQQYQQQQQQDGNLAYQMAGLSVSQGFSAMRGLQTVDLMQHRHIMPPKPIEPPKIPLHNEYWTNVNCRPDIFRCTMTRIPETSSLLQKCRLPLGILIHPFKDLSHLPVVQCNTIVRCRACRTYINPFVHFIDKRRWKCNLCFRTNDIPEEFLFDPQSSTYGDPGRRPEIQSATIEFIAPSEYMLRPPQPAAYVFLLDVSWNAVQSGYLKIVCDTILANLDQIPGDSRAMVGFITYNSAVHFFSMSPELTRPHMMVVKDIDDIFLTCPDTLLVNLAETRNAVEDLLTQIPSMFANENDTQSALGAALEAAHKLLAPIGGRITVFQTQLPNVGPGSLKSREDPNQRAGKEVPYLNPATDFYKKLALDCSAQQIAVDLFLMSSQYADMATLSGMSKFSGGSIHYIPGFHATRFPQSAEKLEGELTRYLTRKIGFESVMRVRCTRGLAIHTFHGNFFVRSTDLLSLPNVNPDAGFGMQVVIEENLTGVQNVCFQAAVLYTSSKGERRIRVHTLCLPVSANLPQLLRSADQEAVVGLIAKMAVDRSVTSSLTDSREAFVNMAVDILSAFRLSESASGGQLLSAPSASLIPVFVLALMKNMAFRIGASTKLDDRVFAMCQMKTLPLSDLLLYIYPSLYPVHNFTDEGSIVEEDEVVPQPPRLPLSYEYIETGGAYLMDTGEYQFLYVCRAVNPAWIKAVFNVDHFAHIQEGLIELPALETYESTRLRSFMAHLQNQRFMPSTLVVMRDDSKNRMEIIYRLVEDKTDCGSSYYEFLQMLKSLVK